MSISRARNLVPATTLAFVLTGLLSMRGTAQDDSLQLLIDKEANAANRAAFAKGSTSLQFGFVQLLDFTSFDGGFISMKRHLSDRSAMRLGVDLTFSRVDEERESSIFAGDSLANFDARSTEVSENTVGMQASYLYYPHPEMKPALYLGGGPSILYAKGSQEGTEELIDHSERIDRSSKRWELGVRSCLGVEYLIAAGFSIHGEYRMFAGHVDSENEASTVRTDTGERTWVDRFERKGWFIEDQSVEVGLSLYF